MALDEPLSHISWPRTALPPETVRPKRRPMPILRVRTGCLTCRRRKKKCDEAKPVCSGCDRNKLECSWPRPHEIRRPGRSSATAENTNRDATPGRSGNPNAVATGPIDESSVNGFLDYMLQTASCTSPFTTPASEVAESAMSPGGSSSSSGPDVENVMSLSHDAAENPITDSTCPLLPPSLLDCTFRNEEAPNDNTFGRIARAETASAGELGRIPQGLSLLPDLSAGSLELLSHYLAVTSKSMDNSAGREDPFVVQLIPLAFGSDLVLHLLLTQSAVHRAAAKMAQDTDLLASEHYNQSLILFRQGISRYNIGQSRETLSLAVGALIMCLVEVCPTVPVRNQTRH